MILKGIAWSHHHFSNGHTKMGKYDACSQNLIFLLEKLKKIIDVVLISKDENNTLWDRVG